VTTDTQTALTSEEINVLPVGSVIDADGGQCRSRFMRLASFPDARGGRWVSADSLRGSLYWGRDLTDAVLITDLPITPAPKPPATPVPTEAGTWFRATVEGRPNTVVCVLATSAGLRFLGVRDGVMSGIGLAEIDAATVRPIAWAEVPR
jgi:hypothetical protein